MSNLELKLGRGRHEQARLAGLLLVVAVLMAVARAFGPADQAAVAALVAQASKPAQKVTVTPDEGSKRVDITIAGMHFTSYLWAEHLKKPVLYPLRSANGTLVTRGWPLDPRPGERVDHPHHVGLWFNYGNVNGLDFWNNSDSIKAENRAKMGTIVHRGIVEARSGSDSGTLITQMDWTDARGAVLLHERAVFVFRGDDTIPQRRAGHNVDGCRRARRLHRQQGGSVRTPRRTSARASIENPGSVH